jgi:hypothetical protein
MSTRPATLVLGLLAIVLIGAALTETPLPFIASDRAALITLAIIGFAMCSSGPLGQIAKTGAWLSWAGVLGILLGVVALGIVGAVLTGTSLPLIYDEQEAFFALASIFLIKIGIGTLFRAVVRTTTANGAR